MKEILTTFGLPILTGIFAFLGSIYKSRIDLKKQIDLNNAELEKVREQCNNEIEKIKAQAETQAQLYEKNAQTDITTTFMNTLFKNPKISNTINDFMIKEMNKSFLSK